MLIKWHGLQSMLLCAARTCAAELAACAVKIVTHSKFNLTHRVAAISPCQHIGSLHPLTISICIEQVGHRQIDIPPLFANDFDTFISTLNR